MTKPYEYKYTWENILDDFGRTLHNRVFGEIRPEHIKNFYFGNEQEKAKAREVLWMGMDNGATAIVLGVMLDVADNKIAKQIEKHLPLIEKRIHLLLNKNEAEVFLSKIPKREGLHTYVMEQRAKYIESMNK